MRKNVKALLMSVMITGSFTITSCKDDNNDFEIDDPTLPALEEGARDLTYGKSVVIIEDDDDLANGFRFKLATKRKVEVNIDGGHPELNPLNLRIETDNDGTKHLISDGIDFGRIKNYLPLIYHINLKVADKSKEMTLILRSSTKSEMSPDEIEANVLYSYARNTIGRGVDVTNDFGPDGMRLPILIYKTFNNNRNDNLVDLVETDIKEGRCWEWGGQRFSQTHYEYSWSLGFKGQLAKKNGVLKGSMNVNQYGSSTMMANYEYYVCALRQERNDVVIHTRILNNLDTLYTHMDAYLNKVLNDSTSVEYQDYPDTDQGMFDLVAAYGTHLVTKGTFGGLFNIVYSRQENMHQTTVGEDISASVKYKFKKDKTPEEKIEKWWQALGEMMNSTYIQGDIDESWYNENYKSATKGHLDMKAVGHDSSMSLDEWKEGCDAGDVVCTRYDKYYANGVHNEDNSNLIPLYQLVKDTTSTRYHKLKGYIDQYIDTQAPGFYEDRLILADFMMKIGERDEAGNFHAPGQPQPFCDKSDYDGQDLLYIPLYVNYNGPKYEFLGHALETNQDEYVVGTSNNPHYWYCAFGYESQTLGIYDVRFGKTDQFGLDSNGKPRKDDNGKSMENYQLRGNHANEGIVGSALNNNYVFLCPPMTTKEKENVITAIGLADNWENYTEKDKDTADDVDWGYFIYASTPGAEYRVNYNVNRAAFNDWWNNNYEITDPQNGEFYEGYRTPTDVRLVLSRSKNLLYNWYDPDNEDNLGLSWGNLGMNSEGVSTTPVLEAPFQYAIPW